MPVFWSVNKQIQTDTVFDVIICEKHGTSTRATAPRAAKIWPRRAIFGPVPVTRYPRAPCRFCRSPVRGSRFSRQRPAAKLVRQRAGFFCRLPVAGRVFSMSGFGPERCRQHSARCVLAGTFGLGRGRRASA